MIRYFMVDAYKRYTQHVAGCVGIEVPDQASRAEIDELVKQQLLKPKRLKGLRQGEIELDGDVFINALREEVLWRI